MAQKQIKNYNQVLTPTVNDLLLIQQGGVTMNETISQIFSNVDSLSAAGVLDGTEVIFCRQSATNKKVTVASLAQYILENS